jgi:hypothetical protein
MLSSGAVCLVERIPDYEGLGLIDGVNCALWRDWDDLKMMLAEIVDWPNASEWYNMRRAAVSLSADHTWQARMPELLACVYAVREARQ